MPTLTAPLALAARLVAAPSCKLAAAMLPSKTDSPMTPMCSVPISKRNKSAVLLNLSRGASGHWTARGDPAWYCGDGCSGRVGPEGGHGFWGAQLTEQPSGRWRAPCCSPRRDARTSRATCPPRFSPREKKPRRRERPSSWALAERDLAVKVAVALVAHEDHDRRSAIGTA